MKFIFYNRKGIVIHSYNHFQEIQDIISKPNAKSVKIITLDGSIKEYTMINRDYQVRHDLETDTEEAVFKYYVEDCKK